MFVYIVVSAAAGGALAEIMRRLSIHLIKARTGDFTENKYINGKLSPAWWMLAGAALCGLTALLTPDDRIGGIAAMAMTLVLLSIAAVDLDIRKIPNEMLLALLGIKLVSLLVYFNVNEAINSLIGFALGAILFFIPVFSTIGIGMGDMKLIAVMGFCLGFTGLLQTLVVMGIAMGIYALVLVITKRGGLKSTAAMGPPLALGMFLTLLFPVVQII
jgi:prepilin signal peptidase PulO-like enzyme (type II secretory pathway)